MVTDKRLQDVEAEGMLLGMFLARSEHIPEILAEVPLKPEHFSTSTYRNLYALIEKIMLDGDEVDLMSVALKINEEGNEVLLPIQCELADIAAMADCKLAYSAKQTKKFKECAHTVYRYWHRRSIINLLTSAAEGIAQSGGQYDSIRNDAMQKITDFLTQSTTTSSNLHYLDETVLEVFEKILKAIETQDDNTGFIPSGLEHLDNYLSGGLRPKELAIIAGRPSCGKTALGVFLAYQALKDNPGATVFLSAEMGYEELTKRFLAFIGKVNLKYLTNPSYFQGKGEELQSLMEATEFLSQKQQDRRFYIEDSDAGQFNENKVSAVLQKAVIQNGKISIVLVDYLQLIANTSNEFAHRELSKWTKFFKGISKKYDCPVVLLSQLNRGVEQRSDKRPILSDLKESGAIEEDADVVMLLYREDYYETKGYYSDSSLLEINVAKNRNGETGVAKVVFRRDIQDFETIDDSDYEGL